MGSSQFVLRNKLLVIGKKLKTYICRANFKVTPPEHIMRYTHKDTERVEQPTIEQKIEMIENVLLGCYTSIYPINNDLVVSSMSDTEITITNADEKVFVTAVITDDNIDTNVRFKIFEMQPSTKYNGFENPHNLDLDDYYEQSETRNVCIAPEGLTYIHNYKIIPESHIIQHDAYIELIAYMLYVSQILIELQKENKKD